MNRRTHDAGVDAPDSQDAIIAVFDVLGFSSRVAGTPLDQLGENYRSLLKMKQHAAHVPVLSLAGVDEWTSPSAVFSDTIIFWATAEPEAADSLLTTCSVLLAEALDRGWPMRGGIAAGRCILDRRSRVFIGQPIIDAHLLEQAQEWIGAAVHPSCLAHPTIGAVVRHCDNVVAYTPPLKPTYRETIEFAIEWSSRTIDWDQSLAKLARDASGSASQKYAATRKFIVTTRPHAVGDAV